MLTVSTAGVGELARLLTRVAADAKAACHDDALDLGSATWVLLDDAGYLSNVYDDLSMQLEILAGSAGRKSMRKLPIDSHLGGADLEFKSNSIFT